MFCFSRDTEAARVRRSSRHGSTVMKLQFRSNDLEGRRWQQSTANALRQSLGRLLGLVASVKVRLDDVNGPGGGVDKRCKVEVLVRGSGPVEVSATARTWQASVDAVATRLRQKVLHQLQRSAVKEQATARLPAQHRAKTAAFGGRRLQLVLREQLAP